jgi:hypothetical protein
MEIRVSSGCKNEKYLKGRKINFDRGYVYYNFPQNLMFQWYWCAYYFRSSACPILKEVTVVIYTESVT